MLLGAWYEMRVLRGPFGDGQPSLAPACGMSPDCRKSVSTEFPQATVTYRWAVPATPDPSIPPDEISKRVREATQLLAQAVDRLRDARDLLDEAAQVESLPAGLAGWFQAYEGVVESLRRNLDAALKWDDDKAELLFSRHSPLKPEGRPRD